MDSHSVLHHSMLRYIQFTLKAAIKKLPGLYCYSPLLFLSFSSPTLSLSLSLSILGQAQSSFQQMKGSILSRSALRPDWKIALRPNNARCFMRLHDQFS